LMSRNRVLAMAARRLLAETLGVELPCPETMLASMATVPLPRPLQSPPSTPGRPDSLYTRLFDEYGIEVPLVSCGEPARRHVRISAHAYNALEQYRYLAATLGALASSRAAPTGN
jgi:isopenicillin-N epimerase